MRLLARLLRARDDTVVPAVCYDSCNNAYLEAVSVGKTPALCAPNSAFIVYVNECDSCITANSPSVEVTSKSFVNPNFSQYIAYCEISAPSAVVSASTAFSSRPPTPSYTIPTSWLTSTVLTLTTALPDVNNKSITATLTPTIIYTRPDWTGFVTSTTQNKTTATSAGPAPVSSAPVAAESPPDASRAWIAGPVVGSVAGLVLVTLAVAFFLRRRKRRRDGASYTGGPELQGDSAYKEYKPPQQLHADPTSYHELDATQQWEMPANEVAAREMAAREEGVWRPSAGEVPAQNQAVYPGPDQTAHTGYDQGLYTAQDQTMYPGHDPAAYPGPDQAGYQGHDQHVNVAHDQVVHEQ